MSVKILVVDDEPDLEILIRRKFRRKIRANEMELLFAHNGVEALKLLNEHEDVDLVVTDINMPEMDGLTLLNEIGTLDRIMKAVVMSAYGDLDNIRTAMNRGSFDFITKPIDFKDFEITINKSLAEVALLKKGFSATQKFKEEKDRRMRAETSRRFKEQFLANMSHEIRTPMNAVVGITNLLLKKSPREDQTEYLQIVKQSAQNLLVIINDILDLSKIEAGKMEFEDHPFSIHQIVRNVVKMLDFKAQEKKLQLSSHIHSNVPKAVSGDVARLTQVLMNLVGNAIKFTEEGEVNISVEVEKMEEDTNTTQINFAISDTGIGIEAPKINSIFDTFSQADSSISRRFGGTGLGLSISKQLVDLQGGALKVESEWQKGSTFSFMIPFKMANESELAEYTPSDADKNNQQALKNVRILLVEDNEFNQVVAVDTLKLLVENLQIDIAENGQIAIDQLQRKEYDIVLMDISMPVMNGYEATTHIRQKLRKPISQIPIMAMTASATTSEIERCFEVGMDEYIAKPFLEDELLQKLSQLFHKTGSSTKNGATKQPKTRKKTALGSVLNMAFLEKFTKKDPSKMSKYINIFLKNAPNQLESLNENLEANNWNQLRATAHSLKSQLRYMGVFPLAETIQTVENNAAEEIALDALPSLVAKVTRITQQAIKELQEKLQSLNNS
ncbi:MAG: response regulator [Chitinophagales bacterium]